MKPVKPLEKHIQRDVIAWLARNRVEAVAVPNGAVLAGDDRARAMQAAALKRSGMSPGFPDLILFSRAHGVGFIEIKREGEKLRKEQADWSDKLQDYGQRWATVRSVDDARETLREWGWL